LSSKYYLTPSSISKTMIVQEVFIFGRFRTWSKKEDKKKVLRNFLVAVVGTCKGGLAENKVAVSGRGLG
jgi:hypothetical protein